MFLGACGATNPLELSVTGPRGDSPERVVIDRPYALIGRDRRCEIRLRAKGVAPRHAYLQRIAGRAFVVNLHAGKGSRGRDLNITSGWLQPGDALVIGPYSIRLAGSADNVEARSAAWPDQPDPLVAGSVDQIQLPTAILDLQSKSGEVQRRRVDRVLTLVGRATSCHVRLLDSSVSPIHCALLLSPDGLWVVDLRSRDGTWVNGCQVRWAQVTDGASLQIGHSIIRTASQHAMRSNSPGPFLEAASIGDHLANRPPLDTSDGIGEVSPQNSAYGMPLASPIPPSANSLVIGDPIPLVPAAVPLGDPTVHQIVAMQQHMLLQFRQSMLMMAQTFSGMWQSEMELLHEVLDRLGGLKRQVRGLSSRQKKQSTRHIRQNSTARNKAEQNGSKSHLDDKLPIEPLKLPQQDSAGANSATAGRADPQFHMWLNERIASLDQERQGAWRKLCDLLLGK
jgi:pSer/pThr/pTyr-binding forkhead associated (FHA) protein